MSVERLMDAIQDDDRAQVKKLLAADPALAKFPVEHPKLYQSKILHWIYAGDTTLHLAAAGHRVEIVRLLLAAGANPNSIMNHRASGPLHYAADGCPGNSVWDADQQVATIQCLLDAGADFNAPDKNGATPLHRAVRTRCAAAARCLLDAGANASSKNKPGSTPFHLAVQNTGRGGSGLAAAKLGQKQIIEIFLSRGVSIQLKDGQGKSVLDSATSADIRALLRA